LCDSSIRSSIFCTELASGLRPHRDGRKWLIFALCGPFDASGYSVSGSIYMVVGQRAAPAPRWKKMADFRALRAVRCIWLQRVWFYLHGS
jgi:hypothetical protein